jgi:hypothetical protein
MKHQGYFFKEPQKIPFVGERNVRQRLIISFQEIADALKTLIALKSEAHSEELLSALLSALFDVFKNAFNERHNCYGAASNCSQLAGAPEKRGSACSHTQIMSPFLKADGLGIARSIASISRFSSLSLA